MNKQQAEWASNLRKQFRENLEKHHVLREFLYCINNGEPRLPGPILNKKSIKSLTAEYRQNQIVVVEITFDKIWIYLKGDTLLFLFDSNIGRLFDICDPDVFDKARTTIHKLLLSPIDPSVYTACKGPSACKGLSR